MKPERQSMTQKGLLGRLCNGAERILIEGVVLLEAYVKGRECMLSETKLWGSGRVCDGVFPYKPEHLFNTVRARHTLHNACMQQVHNKGQLLLFLSCLVSIGKAVGSSPKSSTYCLVWVTSSQSPNFPGPLLSCVIVLMNRLVEKMHGKCLEECLVHVKGLINIAYYYYKGVSKPLCLLEQHGDQRYPRDTVNINFMSISRPTFPLLSSLLGSCLCSSDPHHSVSPFPALFILHGSDQQMTCQMFIPSLSFS